MGGRRGGFEMAAWKESQSGAHTDSYIIYDTRIKYGRVYLDIIHPINAKQFQNVCFINAIKRPVLHTVGLEACLAKLGDGSMGSIGLTTAVTITRPGICEPYVMGIVNQADAGDRRGAVTPSAEALEREISISGECPNFFRFGNEGTDTEHFVAHNGEFPSGYDADAYAGIVARADGMAKLTARNLQAPDMVKILLELDSSMGNIELIRRPDPKKEQPGVVVPTGLEAQCNPLENAAYGGRLIEFLSKMLMDLDEYIACVGAIAIQQGNPLSSFTALVAAKSLEAAFDPDIGGPNPAKGPSKVEIKLAAVENKLAYTTVFPSAEVAALDPVLGATALHRAVDGKPPYTEVFAGERVWANLGFEDALFTELQEAGGYYETFRQKILKYATEDNGTTTFVETNALGVAEKGFYTPGGTDLRVPFVRISKENSLTSEEKPGGVEASKYIASADIDGVPIDEKPKNLSTHDESELV